MNRFMKTSGGYTLIEMAVVILIISILAVAMSPIISKASDKAIIAEAQTSLSALNRSLDLYYLEYGHYPKNANELARSKYYNSSDVKCTYVDDSCFDYKFSGGEFQLICSSKSAGKTSKTLGTDYTAPKIEAFKKMNVEITLDEKGVFKITYLK